MCFSFQLLYYSALTGSFLYFLVFVEVLTLVMYSFSSSVNILITIGLNCLSGKLFISVSLGFSFFQGFILFFHLKHIPLSSHFV